MGVLAVDWGLIGARVFVIVVVFVCFMRGLCVESRLVSWTTKFVQKSRLRLRSPLQLHFGG